MSTQIGIPIATPIGIQIGVGGVTPVPENVMRNEDGTPMLNEDGSYMLKEE